jgi:hypothetical protein
MRYLFLSLSAIVILCFSCTSDTDLFSEVLLNDKDVNIEEAVDEETADEETTDEETAGDDKENDKENDNSLTGNHIFYVTTTGIESNSGKTESEAWSIEKAFSSAKSGNIIYVKAGNYGDTSVEVANSGSNGNPIRFIGYKDIPGDIKSNNAPTVTFEDYKNNNDGFDSNEMPTLVGTRIENEGLGRGIKLFDKHYIELENFQIKFYKTNIVNRGGKYCKFTNIITTDAGDFNLNHTDMYDDTGRNMTGNGLTIEDGDYNIVKNSMAINCGMRGFQIENGSDYSEHYNSFVYSDNNVNSTDYYYLIYDSKYVVLDNIYVERAEGMHHIGHGICFKDGAQNNILRNSKVKNTRIELSFDNVSNNVVENCIIEGGVDKIGCISVANGAHDNIFKNITVTDATGGVKFEDWIDGDGDVASNAGYNNEFVDCIFSGMEYGVAFFFWDVLNTEAYDNTFRNCSFDNFDVLFQINRPNRSNSFISCSFSNIEGLINSRSKTGLYPDFPLDAIFENSEVYNLGFQLPD